MAADETGPARDQVSHALAIDVCGCAGVPRIRKSVTGFNELMEVGEGAGNRPRLSPLRHAS